MQQDVLEIVAPPLSFSLQHYLAPKVLGSTNPNIVWRSTPDDDGKVQLVYCKGFVTQNGSIIADPLQAPISNPVIGLGPWDWMVATPSWIRQKMTENIWTNLATGKLESMTGDGVRRLPRWVPYDQSGKSLVSFSWTMTRPETDYTIIGITPSGQQYPTITKNTDNGVRCTFRGPYQGIAIDDLAAGEDWIEDYEWGGSLVNGVMIYSTLERVTHRRGYGRYMWQAFIGDGKGGYSSLPVSQSQQTVIKALPMNLQPVQYVF